jgi:hypothetical protein
MKERCHSGGLPSDSSAVEMGAQTARLYAIGPVVGNWMEPAIPHGSINLFKAGTDGCHSGKVVCVSRFGDSGPLESRSVGIIAITNPEAPWPEQALRLDFLSRAAQSIPLTDASYRIVSEWITVLDGSTYEPVRAGAHQSPPHVEPPTLDEWMTMPVDRVVRIAAGFPTPPEVFAKYPMLVAQQPTLSHILMTNFAAFQRWTERRPRIMKRLAAVGRACKVPGGQSLPQMIATEWVNRGKSYQEWYDDLIVPMLRR